MVGKAPPVCRLPSAVSVQRAGDAAGSPAVTRVPIDPLDDGDERLYGFEDAVRRRVAESDAAVDVAAELLLLQPPRRVPIADH